MDPAEKTKYHAELSALFQVPKTEPTKTVESEKYFKVCGSCLFVTYSNEIYVQVKWTRVPDLVERRKVFLKGGWAYVPSKEISSIIFQEFQVLLEKALEVQGICLVFFF